MARADRTAVHLDLRIGAGLVMLGLHGRLLARWDSFPRPEGKAIFDAAVHGTVAVARRLADELHDGRLVRTMGIAVVSILAVATTAFLSGDQSPGQRAMTPVPAVAVVGWGIAAWRRLRCFGSTVTACWHW